MMSERISVSTVTSATDTGTRDYDASTVIEAIRTGGKKLRGQVEQIRDTLASELSRHGDSKRAKQVAGEVKKQLPAVLWSGTFTKRANDALAWTRLMVSWRMCARSYRRVPTYGRCSNLLVVTD